MEPEFGSRLRLLIFEPNDQILQQAIIDETKGALTRWDPFIDVRAVAINADEDSVKIFIDYIDKRSDLPTEETIVFSLRRA